MQTGNENGKGCFESYPVKTVLVSNLFTFALYGIGAYIMFRAGVIWLALYLVFIAWQEISILRKSCRDCYYYGKVCAFGKGKIACLVVKKGKPEDFGKRQATWKSLVPDLLVALIPVTIAIILMIIDFSWVLTGLLISILLLASIGNAYVRGNLSCKYCAQRKLGCPAERLFDKSKSKP